VKGENQPEIGSNTSRLFMMSRLHIVGWAGKTTQPGYVLPLKNISITNHGYVQRLPD
jgi:hypothetical protein